MEEEETPPAAPPVVIAPTSVKLTQEEASDTIEHINRKAVAPNDACPVCGSPSNLVLDDIYQVAVLTNQPVIGGLHQPLISTVCYGCGFVRFFNKFIVDSHIKAEKEAANLPAAQEGAENGG